MRISKTGLIYLLLVFGTGFALAFIRIPFLVPRFGVRAAELMEIHPFAHACACPALRFALARPPAARCARR